MWGEGGGGGLAHVGADVLAYRGFKSLIKCIEGHMMGLQREGGGRRRQRERAWQSVCMCTFHCSAKQKIITDGAPSSRVFPNAANDRGAEEVWV